MYGRAGWHDNSSMDLQSPSNEQVTKAKYYAYHFQKHDQKCNHVTIFTLVTLSLNPRLCPICH